MKVYSVQPRFKYGDYSPSWAMVDGIFRMGEELPPYGSPYRDLYLAYTWFQEPVFAGVLSTFIEKVQTVNWKIVGGRNVSNFYARVLHDADGGLGWSFHEGVCALNFLTTDKGSVEELGRVGLTDDTIEKLQDYYNNVYQKRDTRELTNLRKLIEFASDGRVGSIQAIDTTRLIPTGLPDMRWRYYPDGSLPTAIPDKNLIQIIPMPSGRERYVGIGHCALSRVLYALKMMSGYLRYHRQEIGDIPPELVAIINGMDGTEIADIMKKYRTDKDASGLDEYGKILFLGSNDPMMPITLDIRSLITGTKSFNYIDMVEFAVKLYSENVGEDVGEFWLLQRGESKTVQTIQALKSKAKGVARYLQEKERHYNMRIMPFGTTFEYDNQDDEADRLRNEILAIKIDNLSKLAALGLDREDPAYTIDQITNLAVQWEIIPPKMSGESVPDALGAMLKEIGSDDTWAVDKNFREYKIAPLLKTDKDLRSAEFLYGVMKDMVYPKNGLIAHQPLDKVVM